MWRKAINEINVSKYLMLCDIRKIALKYHETQQELTCHLLEKLKTINYTKWQPFSPLSLLPQKIKSKEVN